MDHEIILSMLSPSIAVIVSMQCWSPICLHAMFSVACAAALLLSEKLSRLWVKCLGQDNCTDDCSFIDMASSVGL